jgi:hypothetical protein
MSPAQRGAYWQLICWQMQAEDGHVPAEIEHLSRLADINLSDPSNTIVLEAFPLRENGLRANGRALSVWKERKGLVAMRQAIGRAGGLAKAQASASAKALPIATPNATDLPEQLLCTSTSTSTTTRDSTPRKRGVSREVELYRWDDLAKVYPADKLLPDKRAKAWWRKHVAEGDDLLVADILAGASAWTATRQYRDGYGFGICRFLDERLWQRTPPPDPAPAQGNPAFDLHAHNMNAAREAIENRRRRLAQEAENG